MVNVNCVKGNDISTPMHEAANKGHTEVVKLLLRGGAEVDKKDKFGMTPLNIAARNCHKNVVKVLLDEMADPNKANNYGYTPLGWASNHEISSLNYASDVEDVVKLLLDNGENPNNALERHGWTPLHVAVIWNRKDVVQVLLDRGADPNMADNLGDTAQSIARLYGYRDIVNMLE